MTDDIRRMNDFGFDDELFELVAPYMLSGLFRYYWRVDPIGIENVPGEGGALIVSNHSGVIPIDAAMIKAAAWFREDGQGRNVRILIERFVMDLPFINVFFNRTGQVLACPENTLELLRKDHLVAVFPEGVRGISKTYDHRYQLQRFGRGGFVRMALETGKPIIPTAVVGAEEAYRVIYNLKPLAKLLGFPHIPVSPTFPLLGPLGMIPNPTKWFIAFGKPLQVDHFPAGAADDDALVHQLSDQVRDIIQQMLLTMLEHRRSVLLG